MANFKYYLIAKYFINVFHSITRIKLFILSCRYDDNIKFCGSKISTKIKK